MCALTPLLDNTISMKCLTFLNFYWKTMSGREQYPLWVTHPQVRKRTSSPTRCAAKARRRIWKMWTPTILARVVLRILFRKFWWFEPILWNFANFGPYRLSSKFWKKSCHTCDLILGPNLENFDFRILSKSQSYDKPPWRNFDFVSNFWFLWKSKIWNP